MSLRTMSHTWGTGLVDSESHSGRPRAGLSTEENSMKPVVLHTGSVVAGIAIAVVGLVVVGAKAPKVQGFLRPPPRAFEIIGIPAPNDMVTIKAELGPFTVPPGRLLVLTGLGHIGVCTGCSVALVIDAAVELNANVNITSGQCSIAPIPTGFAIPSGSVVTFAGCCAPNARAVGYLADLLP